MRWHMFYTNEMKKFLGRYFKYIREEKNIKISEVVDLGICDYKTLKRIENGESVKSNVFYDQLMSYYYIEEENIEVLFNTLFPLLHNLYNAVEYFDIQEMKNILNQTKIIIKNKTKDHIIKEYNETLEFVNRFYIQNEYLEEEEIKRAINLMILWKNELTYILLEICEKSNWNRVLNRELIDKLNSFTYDDNVICKYWYSSNCSLNLSYTESLIIFKELMLEFNKKNNILRELDCLMSLFNIYRDIDMSKAQACYNELINFMNSDRIPVYRKANIHYNLGMFQYMNRNYDLALNHFKESYHIERRMKSLLFICACKSRLNKIDEFNYEIDETNILYPYIKYYKMKFEHQDAKMLEKYILVELMNELMKEKDEEPLWSMFRFEMSQLVKVTKRYKHYFEFEEKIPKIN